MISYGIPAYVSVNHKVQFTSEIFAALCTMLSVRHLKTALYHLETSGRVSWYNHTIVNRLQHCNAEHQMDWYRYVQRLKYTYTTQAHKAAIWLALVLYYHGIRKDPKLCCSQVAWIWTNMLGLTSDGYASALSRKSLHWRATLIRIGRRRAQYKHQYDETVHSQPIIVPNKLVCLDRPPLASGKIIESGLETASVDKPWSRKTECFRTLKVLFLATGIMKDVTSNVVSIQRINAAPKLE